MAPDVPRLGEKIVTMESFELVLNRSGWTGEGRRREDLNRYASAGYQRIVPYTVL